MNLPSQPSDESLCLDAYWQFVEGRAPLPLSGWETIAVGGHDARGVIHNLCTQDVRELADSSGCEAFFPNVKGKIAGHGYVLAMSDGLWVTAPAGSADRLIPHWDRYVIREDVQFANPSDQQAWLAVVGESWLKDRGGTSLPQLPKSRWQHVRVALGEAGRPAAEPFVVVRSDLPFAGCFWIGGTTAAVARLTSQPVADVPVLRAALEIVRIEGNWPWWGVDFDDAQLPQEVGRDSEALHFQKGCYLGQETIARLDALGHVNRRLAWIGFDAEKLPPGPGETLLAGDQSVGTVTSSCWSPRQQRGLALAMVRRGAFAPGTRLASPTGVAGEVLDPVAAVG